MLLGQEQSKKLEYTMAEFLKNDHQRYICVYTLNWTSPMTNPFFFSLGHFSELQSKANLFSKYKLS